MSNTDSDVESISTSKEAIAQSTTENDFLNDSEDVAIEYEHEAGRMFTEFYETFTDLIRAANNECCNMNEFYNIEQNLNNLNHDINVEKGEIELKLNTINSFFLESR